MALARHVLSLIFGVVQAERLAAKALLFANLQAPMEKAHLK